MQTLWVAGSWRRAWRKKWVVSSRRKQKLKVVFDEIVEALAWSGISYAVGEFVELWRRGKSYVLRWARVQGKVNCKKRACICRQWCGNFACNSYRSGCSWSMMIVMDALRRECLVWFGTALIGFYVLVISRKFYFQRHPLYFCIGSGGSSSLAAVW